MVVGMLPATAFAAADEPTEIRTADDFAEMNPSGNYKLTADITVTDPYSKGKFTGTFDGNGHTVTLNLNVTSGNAGLFRETGSGATIQNVVVDANVVSSASSSYPCTAGLIGKISGATTVKNCGVSGIVKNTSSSATYNGGLIGFVTASGTTTIQNCYSTAAVTAGSSSSAATGGLIGYLYAKTNVENCYSAGSVTTTSTASKVGGLLNAYSSSSYPVTVKNCYTAATVSASKGYFVSYNYGNYCTFENCFYDSTIAGEKIYYTKVASGLTGKTTAELKDLTSTLGSAFREDTTSTVNNGYPMLSWQYFDPDASYDVTFDITPAGSKLTWSVDESTSYVYTVDSDCTPINVGTLPVGSYTYTVTNDDDYAAQSGTVTVRNKAVSVKVKLVHNDHTLTFTGLPNDAELTVKNGDTTLTPNSDGSYTVKKGEYTYSVTAFGYQSITDQPVTVGAEDKTEAVTMTQLPVDTVTFTYADDATDPVITVTTGSRTMSAKDGPDGKVYELPVGYSYDWTFRSTNYAKKTGTIDLTGEDAARSETVSIPMTAKTAWEGGDDAIEPAKNSDGVYQITSGSELAWLAQEVNAGRGTNYNAVLCNDIDLGNENWTPIGKSSSCAYKGTFDGQGFAVKKLKITSSKSDNYGLFGYVSGGKVKNVAVSGEIKIDGNGSSYGYSYGAAGIVGSLTGNGATVENCINKAKITGQQNVGGIVGYISGSYGKYVTACVNTGEISSNSHNAGGIVGYISGQVTVDSCYNRGTITSGNRRAGGIAAYMNSSSAKVQNCYSTGTISVTYGEDVKSIVGYKNSGTVADSYFLNSQADDGNATPKSEADLKALASTLGAAFADAPSGLNDGYPVLTWQIPTYTVTVNVSPADASFVIEGQTGTQNGGTWSYKLKDGTYSYTVSAFGYEDINGTITVSGGEVTQNVTLTLAARKTVTFQIAPDNINASVTFKWKGQSVDAAPGEGSFAYILPVGTYDYTVKAKGYGKQTGTLTLDADMTVDRITLSPTTAWDGNEKEQPSGYGTQAAPYEIDNGAQLAWLAQTVNEAESVQKLYVKLTDDIDLGNYDFTPIGKNTFYPFSGVFDGQGHVVSGLNVSNKEYAGLFGVVKDAEIKNLVVKGTVSGTGETGGLVGFAQSGSGTVAIENCGNEATVSTTGSYVGGILGKSFAPATIKNSYNTGAVSSSYTGSSVYAGGIAGWSGGSYGTIKITDCYNTGTVTSTVYAGGIRGKDDSASGNEIANCYSIGAVTGADNKFGALAPSSSTTVTNSYYRNGTDGHSGATSFEAMTGTLLDNLGTTNWKTVRGVNNGLPILKWQKDTAPIGTANLADDPQFDLELGYTLSGDEIALTTGKLMWKAKAGAASYIISLWQAVPTWNSLTTEEKAAFDGAATATEKLYYVDEDAVVAALTAEQKAELTQLKLAVENAQSRVGLNGDLAQALADVKSAQEAVAIYLVSHAPESALGYYTFPLRIATDIYDVTGTAIDLENTFAYFDEGLCFDLTATFADLDEGVYFASVTAVVDGSATYLPTAEQVEDEIVGYQEPYNRLKAVTGLHWEGTTAEWNAKDGFTADQVYLVSLYTVTGADYDFVKSFQIPGNYTSVNLGNAFVSGKQYAFTVTAITNTGSDQPLLSDSLPSGYSLTYIPISDPADTKEWVDISSAEDWIALANVEDVPSAGNGSPSEQQLAWNKNYRLTADIDFSTLSAEDQIKTKSIGNVNYPFMGEFDGQGYKITGLTLSNYDSGLFWYVGATGYIHDLTIQNANVLFSDNAAVLVHNNRGIIEKCAVVNANITADTGAVLGGMVSRNYGIIRDSYVQGGKLTSNSNSATGHAGFVGSNEEGGLIERCWTSMEVSTQSDYAGGFVGLGYGGKIKNCFALGNVSARGYSGGFVGRSVYSGNTYENCYAAGIVTVTGSEGNGFIGGNKPDSAFQNDQSEGIVNCYYNSATQSANSYNAVGKALSDMQTEAFLTTISGTESGVWTRSDDTNNGLPYLVSVTAPADEASSTISVKIAIAVYDKETYTFSQSGEIITVEIESDGNTLLTELMDEAQNQGKLTYSYSITASFGRYIHTINDHAVEAPDGWMFTINDELSNTSASLTTVKNNDKILWFEGTTENRFQGPTWDELSGTAVQWETISTVHDLLALSAGDAAAMGKNYKLTADLDLNGMAFNGIGTSSLPFTGVFDGQGHTISNVTISAAEADNVGFFGVIKGATIKNLNLSAVNILGKDKVGGLVGYAQAALTPVSSASLIGNCTVSGTVTGGDQVGGLIGLNEGITDPQTLFSAACAIDKCTADVSVIGNYMAGGLVGENSGTITRSTAKGNVSAQNGSKARIGGFVGGNTGDIYESHSEGAVTGTGFVGGFAGYSSGEVKRCYSLGAVSGADHTGSFAGSITQADTVIGAGKVTVSGQQAQGYIGGFTGNLGGTLVGINSQITIKNAFGNCIGGLSAAGNSSSFISESQKAALNSMKLDTWGKVSDKLFELFGVYLLDTEAAAEAEKYSDSVTLSPDVAVGSVVSLLKPDQSASERVTLSYTVTGNYLSGGSALTLSRTNDTTSAITVSVELKFTDASGAVFCKTAKVILPASTAKRNSLMDAIASGFTETADQWTALDMVLYSMLPNKSARLTDEARQGILNTIISQASESSATVSDRARMELVLRSMGVDSTKLYPVNSNTSFSNASKLAEANLSSGGYYAAPWILLADLQGNLGLTQTQQQAMIDLLKNSMGSDGLFGYEWNGVSYLDPDTAGAALSALARFYPENADAKLIVDTILENLPAAMNEQGSFGSANSDAFVVIGLLAIGKNPADMKASSGASVIDGLLSYANALGTGFTYNGQDNSLATEQGFRALVALALYDGENACNIYDFSGASVVPGRATGSGSAQTPSAPTGDQITVFVTIKGDSGYWMNRKAVTINGQGATVYHAFIKALEGSGITQSGAEQGYVRSMSRNGVTLSEFDKGENSGWLYKVNDQLPSAGLTACSIADGDSIVWYYTVDWTSDPSAGSFAGSGTDDSDQKAANAVMDLISAIGTVTKDSGDAIAAAREAYDALTDNGKQLVGNYDVLTNAEEEFARLTNVPSFTDVTESDYFYEAVQWAVSKGITKGTSGDTFSPKLPCTRCQIITFLWRAAGEPKATNRINPFSDVDEDDYFYEALLWAIENGITQGTSSDTFSPDQSCTRAQMAVFLYRSANSPTVSGTGTFNDVDYESYFASAVIWAAEQGITVGTSGTTFSPEMECTREQIVTFLYRWFAE